MKAGSSIKILKGRTGGLGVTITLGIQCEDLTKIKTEIPRWTRLGSTLLRHMMLTRRAMLRVVLVKAIRSRGLSRSLVSGEGSGWRRQDARGHGYGPLIPQAHKLTLRFSTEGIEVGQGSATHRRSGPNCRGSRKHEDEQRQTFKVGLCQLERRGAS